MSEERLSEAVEAELAMIEQASTPEAVEMIRAGVAALHHYAAQFEAAVEAAGAAVAIVPEIVRRARSGVEGYRPFAPAIVGEIERLAERIEATLPVFEAIASGKNADARAKVLPFAARGKNEH
jgi:hypothetical protein